MPKFIFGVTIFLSFWTRRFFFQNQSIFTPFLFWKELFGMSHEKPTGNSISLQTKNHQNIISRLLRSQRGMSTNHNPTPGVKISYEQPFWRKPTKLANPIDPPTKFHSTTKDKQHKRNQRNNYSNHKTHLWTEHLQKIYLLSKLNGNTYK